MGVDIQEVAIPVHAIAASIVILLAPVNFIRRRKDAAHKTIGRSWVIAIYLTCVTGMFIYINGGFTIFHALAIYTFITTTLGVIAIRRGKKREHVRHMIASWVGALIAGSVAAFVPGRYIPTLAVSDPLLLGSVVAVLVIASTLWVAFVLAYFGRKSRSRAKSRELTRHRNDNPRTDGLVGGRHDVAHGQALVLGHAIARPHRRWPGTLGDEAEPRSTRSRLDRQGGGTVMNRRYPVLSVRT